MEQESKIKQHRVGTITLGVGLVFFGCLFLVHLIVPALNYQIIFHLWPCLLIMLGIEVLIGNHKEKSTFIYDKASIVLIVLLSIFAMGMGVADWCMQQYSAYIALHW